MAGSEKNLEKTTGAQTNQSTTPQHAEPSLIDFGSEAQNAGAGDNSQNLSSKLHELNVKSPGVHTGAIPKTSPQPKKKEDDSDFDMFAQSRTTSYEKSKTSGSTYADNSNVDQSKSLGAAVLNKNPEEEILKAHRQSDFDEMEAWLKANPAAGAGAPEASLTSSEFDRFFSRKSGSVRRRSSDVWDG